MGCQRVEVQGLIEQVEEFWESVSLVSMVEPVRARAKRLLGIHSIRAADALQLAAALAVVYDDPRNQGFVCLDDRLAAAARREGFAVLPG